MESKKFKSKNKNIEGLFLLPKKKFIDHRGTLQKSFTKDWTTLKKFNIKEVYFTTSKKNVLRGFHYQPINGSKKIVFCTTGKFLDVVVDLRKKSKTYGNICSKILTEKSDFAIHIPSGCAHANLSLEKNSAMFYLTTKTFKGSKDRYYLWNSIVFDWGIKKPILSKLDLKAKIIKI